MKTKLKKIFNEYLKWSPPKIFVILTLLIFILFIGIITFRLDNDFWFLINTGKHILTNGFPLVEPFTIHTDLNFIVQQWLTDVIFYLIYNKFGVYVIYIFVNIINIIIVTLIYKLSMLISDNKVKLSVCITIIIDLLLSISFITTRPQIFDIILLLTELYLLELYIKKNNKLYLIGLPIISLLMINLHSSLWLMIFVFLLPYYVEKIILKEKYKLKPLILVTIIMILVGFINPYGIDSITYLFNSYGVKEINNLVGEMKPLTISNGLGAYILIFIVLLSYYYNKKNNKLRYLLLTLGTCYLAMSHVKGLLFFQVCSVLSLSYNFKNIFKEEKKQHSFYKEKKINYSLFILLILFIAIYGYNLYHKELKQSTQPYLYEIAEYLDNNATKDIKLYTDYNNGGYLEYRGYKCYLDPRAEVFLKSNNKKEDILIEWYNLQTGKINYKEFINKYNFDYLVVEETDILYNYLEDSEYEIIFEKELGNYFYEEKLTSRIYKKKDK